MAKRRKTKIRRTRAYASKRTRRRSSTGMKGETALLLGAAAYGGVRAKLSGMLMPYTNKIPLGNVSDEVGMYLALHFGGKFLGNKIPLGKQIIKSGKTIEAARIGEAVARGQLGLGNNASSNSQKMASFR
jgi:hypothetical protein